MKEPMKLTVISLAVAGAIGLSGCGGGGSSSGDVTTASSGSTTSGVITGFGSVFVDGVEFETDASSYSLDDGDDGPEGEDALAVGMVVTVTGTINADGVTGTAHHIEFDDELEGIVNASAIGADGTGTLTVMGQTVNIDSTTVFASEVASIASIDQVVAGNVIEVSGFSSGGGDVYASRVEVKLAAHSGEEIEVKGIIDNLQLSTFDIGGLTVDFSSAVVDDSIPDAILSDGLYVEVKSLDGFNATGDLVASKIELEDDGDMDLDGDEGDDVDLNGVVTAVTSDASFEIGGHTVIIVDDTEFEHGSADNIMVGVSVEVEGELDERGDLIADEIELGIDDDIEMVGKLEAVNNPAGTVTLFGQTIVVNNTTLLNDKQDNDGLVPEHFFDLDDIASGNFVEIDAYRDPDNGDLVAVKFERDDDDGDENELKGTIESVPNSSTLVIAGITVDVGALALPSVSVGDEVDATGNYDIGTSIFTATSLETDD